MYRGSFPQNKNDCVRKNSSFQSFSVKCQNAIYVFEFRKKMDLIRNLRLYFIIIVTKHKDYCDLLDGMCDTMLHSFIK